MKRDRFGIAGGLLGATLVLALASSSSKKAAPGALPSDDWQTAPDFTEADVEAAARMIASENPRGSRQLHIEQIWTQLRARKPGQSLFDRITGGSGFGEQGDGNRPVSTAQEASAEQRQLAREVLAGKHASTLAGAKKFFEPAQQDRALAVAERARAKQERGESLTAQEQRLMKYKRDAKSVRDKWQSAGARRVGAVDGVVFYT